jgi:hypothetical protein
MPEWNTNPWDTSYTYTTPGYSNYRGGGSRLSSAGTVPYGNLATGTNALMTGEAKAPFVANLPDYENLVAQQSKNIGSQLRGEVPQDVINQILQQAAERGVGIGSPGSPNANLAGLLNRFKSSSALQAEGAAALRGVRADTPVPQLFNPSSLFVPEHLAGLELGAAGAGLRSGGGRGGQSIRLPGGALGQDDAWWRQPASWERNYGPSMGGGRIGYFDDYSGPTAATYANLPWGNTYGGGAAYSPGPSDFSDWWDPQFNEQQPLTYTPGQGGISDWSDFGNIDWSMYE